MADTLSTSEVAGEEKCDRTEAVTSDRREFMETATKLGTGALGLGALLALSRNALAQERRSQPAAQAGETMRASALHNRALDRETITCLQQTGMELIAYTYGLEANGTQARAFLSIFKCGTKNGTTCTTCCHP